MLSWVKKYLSVGLASVYLFFSLSHSLDIPGTRAVRWEVLPNLQLSWNEVSHFCRSRGARMVQTPTRVAMHALGQATVQWFGDWEANSNRFNDFWIGLHSAAAGETLNVWEKDCSLHRGGIQAWDTGEPNFLNKDRCARIHESSSLGEIKWRTWDCDESYLAVCEYDVGDCTYDAIPNKGMTSQADAWSQSDVADAAACWSLCLELRTGEDECVAAVFTAASTPACSMHLGQRLLTSSELTLSDVTGSTVLLRTCFNTTEDASVSHYSYSNTDSSPQPAGLSCSDTYQEPSYTDVVPADLVLLSQIPSSVATTPTTTVTTPTTPVTTPITTVTTPITTVTTPTTTAVTTPTTTTVTTPTATVTTGNPTAIISTQSESTPTTGETTETVQQRETTTSQSSSLAAGGETTVTGSSSSSPPPPTASNLLANTTSGGGGGGGGVYSQSSASPGTHKTCPCVCGSQPNSSSSSSSSPPPSSAADNLLIDAKNTSKYRRTKTSAFVYRATDANAGAALTIMSFSVIVFFMLCDLSRIPTCRRCRRHGKGEGETGGSPKKGDGKIPGRTPVQVLESSSSSVV